MSSANRRNLPPLNGKAAEGPLESAISTSLDKGKPLIPLVGIAGSAEVTETTGLPVTIYDNYEFVSNYDKEDPVARVVATIMLLSPKGQNAIMRIAERIRDAEGAGYPYEIDLRQGETLSRRVDAPAKGNADGKPLPSVAPKLWSERPPGRTTNPAEFIRQVYGEWIGKGLSRSHIGKLDLRLYEAYAKWITPSRHPEDDLHLPTEATAPKSGRGTQSAEVLLNKIKTNHVARMKRLRANRLS